MEFKHPKTGNMALVPWNIADARTYNFTRYMDEGGCKDCGNTLVARYVADNACVQCALKEAATIWELWGMGSPDRPDPFPRDRDAALHYSMPYYYTGRLCKGGRHFIQPHVKTGRCV